MRGRFLPKAITTIVVLVLILMVINKPSESGSLLTSTMSWLSSAADHIVTFANALG